MDGYVPAIGSFQNTVIIPDIVVIELFIGLLLVHNDRLTSRADSSRMPRSGSNSRANELASQLAALPYLEAVILGGSISMGLVDDHSDCDLYAYTRPAIEPSAREAILRPRAARLELQRDFWEWEDTWIEHDGRKFEIMYRGCEHAEQEVERRFFRYEASVGYTTCVLHTLAHGRVLVNRNGWFEALQQRVLNTSYPDELVRAVIAKNFPVLGPIISSYEDQIESAYARRDLVSLVLTSNIFVTC
jgi:hypothetical protein